MRYPEILSIEAEPGEFTYDDHFTRLYALGLGAGAELRDLPLVYEKKNLQALPTMAVVMGMPSGRIMSDGELDMRMMVHGEQRLTVHKPLPVAGTLVGTARCVSAIDKGKAKGAVVNIACTLSDKASGERLVTSIMSVFCRGDGGFGGPTKSDLVLPPRPEREPDLELALPTLPQQAALYRLLGDVNPLHIDPDFATAVGFPRPILHGLCTYGIACRAIVRACCDDDPSRIEQFDVRFSSPVYPGETITTRIWRNGNDIAFECVVAERGTTVIKNGYCRLRDSER